MHVQLDYGPLSNFELLTQFGYAIPFNQFDRVQLQLLHNGNAGAEKVDRLEVRHATKALYNNTRL